MKVLIIFALIVTIISANVIGPFEVPVHLRDIPENLEIEGRITNGQDAAERQFPFQAGLSFARLQGGWWCGGTVISREWVLTAAHCTNRATSVQIYLGATNRLTPRVLRAVSSSNFVIHRDYDPNTLANDIALIKMQPVDRDNYIRAVALPKISSSYPTYTGQTAIASGWGRTSDSNFDTPNKLKYTDMQVMANSACARAYGPNVINSKILCTATSNGKSTCDGDSGGPLILNSSQQLIGITSFVALEGCQIGAPVGFIRITSYLDWIKIHTGINN